MAKKETVTASTISKGMEAMAAEADTTVATMFGKQTPVEAKKVPVVAATIDNGAGKMVLTFDNNSTLVIDADTLDPVIRRAALMHGLKQKLVDAAAISRNEETGRSATTADKFAAVKEVYDRLLAGQWNKTREGGSIGGLLFKALCSVYADKTPDAIKAFLDKKTDVEKAALRKMPKIAAAIEAIRAANAKTEGVDVDALLSELDD